MPTRKEDLSFSFSPNPGPAARPEPVNAPGTFRILICADFTGRTNRGMAEPATIAARKTVAVDFDALPAVIAQWQPRLALPLNDTATLPLIFKSLDDFRPDAIVRQVPTFQALLQLRVGLMNPKIAHDFAAKVRTLTGGSAPPSPPPPSAAPGSSGGSDFEQMLQRPIAQKSAASGTDAFIQNIVAGSSVPNAEPDHAALLAFLEDALSAGLRAILHHPAFQAIESAWRGVAFLISRLNTDGPLKFALLDISKSELATDLVNPAVSGFREIVVERARVPGTVPFSLVIGDYEFDSSDADIAALTKISDVMQQAGIPFIAAASPAVAGLESFAQLADTRGRPRFEPGEDWQELRRSESAAHLALVAPRFLLRLPYGPKTDAIDAFPFHEMPGPPVSENYLWGNGAFAIAHAIASGFLTNVANDDPEAAIEPDLDLTDLPAHMALVDGDKEMTPCAQVWLSDHAAETLSSLGLIPLLSVRHSPSARIAGIHSLSAGNDPLAAPWSA